MHAIGHEEHHARHAPDVGLAPREAPPAALAHLLGGHVEPAAKRGTQGGLYFFYKKK